MDDIFLKLETRIVETKIRPLRTQYSLVTDEPIFGMSVSAYKWYIVRIKNENLIKRLKGKCL